MLVLVTARVNLDTPTNNHIWYLGSVSNGIKKEERERKSERDLNIPVTLKKSEMNLRNKTFILVSCS